MQEFLHFPYFDPALPHPLSLFGIIQAASWQAIFNRKAAAPGPPQSGQIGATPQSSTNIFSQASDIRSLAAPD